MTALWLYLVASASAIFGFMLCAILTSGKTADLEAEVWRLRAQLVNAARADRERRAA